MLDQLKPLFQELIAWGGHPFVVGGFVRDSLLGLDPKDIDIEVHGLDTFDVIDCLRKFGKVDEVGRQFGVLKIRFAGLDLDISLPRTERKLGTGHTGFGITVDPWIGIEKALARRDFTINAMAFDMKADGALVDPFHGKQALASGWLRPVGPAFSEDPLRVLRAVQFAARFGMELAPETMHACRTLVPELLSTVSDERIWGEFEKIGAKGTHIMHLEWAIEDAGLQDLFGHIHIPAHEVDLESLPTEKRIPILLAAVGVNPDKFKAMPLDVARNIKHLRIMSETIWEPVGSRRFARTPRGVTFRDAARIRPSLMDEIDWAVLDGPLPMPVTGHDLIDTLGMVPGPAIGETLLMIAHTVDAQGGLTKAQAMAMAAGSRRTHPAPEWRSL